MCVSSLPSTLYDVASPWSPAEFQAQDLCAEPLSWRSVGPETACSGSGSNWNQVEEQITALVQLGEVSLDGPPGTPT